MNNSADNTVSPMAEEHPLAALEGPLGDALRMASIASALISDLMDAKNTAKLWGVVGNRQFILPNDQVEDAIFAANDALVRVQKLQTAFYAALKDAG